MASDPRVLVLDPDPGIQEMIRSAESSGIHAEAAGTISEALQRLGGGSYEAVLCRVDGPQETAFLVRIKHAVPSVPLLALTPSGYPALDDLARESGADDVQSRDLGLAQPSKTVARALGIRELETRAQEAIARNEELSRQHRELIGRHRRTIARSRLLAEKCISPVRAVLDRFAALLIEDDFDLAKLIRRAFREASLPFPLPLIGDGTLAIDYLDGKGQYSNRTAHPMPTCLLLDLHLPGKSGLEVLGWVRSRAEFDRLPIFVLTSASEAFDQAMARGASYVYPKPVSWEGQRQLVREIALRWWFIVQALEQENRSG